MSWTSLWLALQRAPEPGACPGAIELTVATVDGAAVHLHHHPGPGAPVLVVHGLSSNGRSWDIAPDRSLADALVQAGYDAWLLDLRGHGAATHSPSGQRQRRGWNLDDYGRYDLAAAIDHIRAATGRAQVGYVGHSMGGMVAAIYQSWHGDAALSALVVVGSPIDFGAPSPAERLAGRAMRASRLNPVLRGDLATGLSARLGKTPQRLEDYIYAPGSIAPAPRAALMREAVSPMTEGELAHLAFILERGRLVSADGTRDYVADLASLKVPLTVIAGRADRIATADRVRPWIEAAGSAQETYRVAGRAAGLAHDYGHVDLIAGDAVAAEVFPWILAGLGPP